VTYAHPLLDEDFVCLQVLCQMPAGRRNICRAIIPPTNVLPRFSHRMMRLRDQGDLFALMVNHPTQDGPIGDMFDMFGFVVE